MGLLLPQIGATLCTRAQALLERHPENIVGTFWVMIGYGFDDTNIPDWWIDIVCKKNQAQAILDAYQNGLFAGEHGNSLYLGFCIIVTASKENPADISYVVQHLRMVDFEGIGLLKILAKHNIPAHTEVHYPIDFLNARYNYKDDAIPKVLKKIHGWSAQVWEDYCSFLMAEHGQKMIAEYWSRTS